MRQFERITMNPKVMIMGELAAGRTIEQLLADFPYLEEADIRETLAFAAE
jgi:uncharacterized protein (DUF433 family)